MFVSCILFLTSFEEELTEFVCLMLQRIAQTSERIVNFKARLITSII